MHGGFIAGRFYLVEGNPGSGKTTLALQYLLEGRRAEERCLYVTLSETRDELLAGAESHGWSMDGIEVVQTISALPATKDSVTADSEMTRSRRVATTTRLRMSRPSWSVPNQC